MLQIVNTLDNPDEAPKPAEYDLSDEIQQAIIGGVLHDDDLIETAARCAKPEYWRQRIDQVCVKVILDLFKQYATRPNLAMVENEMEKRFGANAYIAQVEASCYIFETERYSPAYLKKQIQHFAERQAARMAFDKSYPYFQRGDFSKGWQVCDECRAFGQQNDESLSYLDSITLDKADWLVKDHLADNSFNVMFGESGAGKSFLCVELALCVATGTPFLGTHEVKQGPVIYIGAEGKTRLKYRFIAWCKEHGIDRKSVDDFVWCPHDFNLTERSEGIALLNKLQKSLQQRHKKEKQPVLFIVDTLPNNLGGSTDSDHEAINAYISTLRYWMEETGASVLSVTHPGHDNANRPRGASTLKPTSDALLRIMGEVEKDTLAVKMVKQKDSEPIEKYRVYSKPIDLALADGSTEQVLTLSGVAGYWNCRLEDLAEPVRDTYDIIRNWYGHTWFEKAKGRDRINTEKHISPATFYRHLDKLADAGFVEVVECDKLTHAQKCRVIADSDPHKALYEGCDWPVNNKKTP